MVGSRRHVSYRTASLVLSAIGLTLAVQSCTPPSFGPEIEADADVGADDAGDGAPSGRLDAAVEGDGGVAPADAAPAPQEDAGDAIDTGIRDTGVAMPGSDAAPAIDAAQSGLPAWAATLPGTYAKRSVTFSYDESLLPSGGNTRNVEHAIVTITQDGAELALSIQLCELTFSVENPGEEPVAFAHERDMPPMTGRLLLDAPDSFSSEPMVQHLGFEPTRGNTCDTSGSRAKFPEQTWIRGSSCQCSASQLPTSLDDCRVTDTDGDGAPGVTATGQYRLTPGPSEIAIAFDYSVTFVDGRVAANRRHELREVRAKAVACLNAAVDYCYAGNNELCPGGSTRLIPIDAQTTCAELDTGAFGPLDSFPVQVDCRAGR